MEKKVTFLEKLVKHSFSARWQLRPRSTDPKLSLLSYSCPVCGISGTGLGQLGARQLAEKPPYHRGKLAPPPPELVKQAFGQPGYALAASMVAMQQGYSGSTT